MVIIASVAIIPVVEVGKLASRKWVIGHNNN